MYNEELGENDILLYTDKYVLIGKNDDNINGISSLRDKAIGVLEEDTSNVRYYLNEAVGVKYTSCKDTQEMIDLLNQEKLFSLLCKLQGLNHLEQEEDFPLYRRIIFECLTLLNEIKGEIENERT